MSWDTSVPAGTALANTLDTVIQALKTDLNTALQANDATLGDAGVFPGGTEPVTTPVYHYRGYRGTTAQRTGLSAAYSGMMFDTDKSALYSYAGGSWGAIGYLIPASTKMVVYQNTAPTGWTLDATVNDRFLRVATSGGGSTSGSFDDLSHVHALSDGYALLGGHLAFPNIMQYRVVPQVFTPEKYFNTNAGGSSSSPDQQWATELGGNSNNANLTHGSAQHAYATVRIVTKDAY